MIDLTYAGKMVSGKNRIQIAWVRGRKIMYPEKKFKLWRSDFQAQILKQWQKAYPAFTGAHVRLTVDYWPGDLIRRDATGMLDALFHALEAKNGGVGVTDDSQFKEIVWKEHELDREHPRVVLTLEAI